MSREIARQVLETEANAIRNLMENLPEEFDRAVELIAACTGRVVFTGLGKSGIIFIQFSRYGAIVHGYKIPSLRI